MGNRVAACPSTKMAAALLMHGSAMGGACSQHWFKNVKVDKEYTVRVAGE